jgi:hypothetical protein
MTKTTPRFGRLALLLPGVVVSLALTIAVAWQASPSVGQSDLPQLPTNTEVTSNHPASGIESEVIRMQNWQETAIRPGAKKTTKSRL